MIPIPHDPTRLVGSKCVYDVYGIPAPALIVKISYDKCHTLKLFVKPDNKRKVKWSYMPFWKEEEVSPEDVYMNFAHFYRTNKRFDPTYVLGSFNSQLAKILDEANIASLLLDPAFNGKNPNDLEVKLWLLICKVNASSKRLTELHSQLREINNNEQILDVRNMFTRIVAERLKPHLDWIEQKKTLGEEFFRHTLSLGYNEALKRFFFMPTNHYFELNFYFQKDRWCASCRVTFAGRLDGSKEVGDFLRMVEREKGFYNKTRSSGFTMEDYKSLAELYRTVETYLQDLNCPVDMEEIRKKLRFDKIEEADPIYVNRKEGKCK